MRNVVDMLFICKKKQFVLICARVRRASLQQLQSHCKQSNARTSDKAQKPLYWDNPTKIAASFHNWTKSTAFLHSDCDPQTPFYGFQGCLCRAGRSTDHKIINVWSISKATKRINHLFGLFFYLDLTSNYAFLTCYVKIRRLKTTFIHKYDPWYVT